MDITKPQSKLKPLKELFRSGKRAHTSDSDAVLQGEQLSAGPAELFSSVRDASSLPEAAVAVSSEPITARLAQPGNAPTAEARDARTAAEIAWSAFKAVLPIVEKVSVVFPPLQSAVGGLIKVISQYDTCKANTEKVEDLARTLDQLQRILSAYPQTMESKQIQRLELIQRIFEDAMATVQTQNDKGRFARLVQGSDDQNKLVDSMGKLTRFVNLLQLEVLGQTGVSVTELHRDIKYEELLKRLEHISTASFESTESDIQTRVECTPGTRTKILEMLTAWIRDPYGKPVFWLNGMAGTGKSTIAQSMCNRLDADGMLAASFFCSRSAGGGRNDARRIIPTIAFQLAYHVPGFMEQVCDVLRTPDRTSQSIEMQLKHLLWEPLDNAFIVSGATWANKAPLVVIVDGLDECSDEGAERFVQFLLRRHEHDLPVHLRFLLFSRSERHIGTPIMTSPVDVSRFELHRVPHSDITRDIRKYVEEGFVMMSGDKGWGDNWYNQDDIDFIVIQADVLFIYASTVLKFLRDSKFRPESRLDVLRQMTFTATTTKTGALRPLHVLYSVILMNLGKVEDLEAFEVDLVRNVLFVLSCSPNSLSIPVISELLGTKPANVWACISSLSSVVLLPPNPHEHSKPIMPLHASFPEFIQSSSLLLPEHFRFNVKDSHCCFLARCLEIMNEGLREGLFGAEADRWTRRSDIPSGALSQAVSPTLQYAARSWVSHGIKAELQEPMSESAKSVFAPMSTFVNTHLLHWLEFLAWTESLKDVAGPLGTLISCGNLKSLAPDFAHAFSDILELIETKQETFKDYPYEIYHTTLIWLPKSICAPLARERRRGSIPTVERGLPATWDSKGARHTRNLAPNSLFVSSALARWLSVSDESELIIHEWDTRDNSEVQYSIPGVLPNTRIISKIADNGIFCLDPETTTISFRPISRSPSLSNTKTWYLEHSVALLSSNQRIGLTVSVNGKFAIAWNRDSFHVWLVDVEADRCYHSKLDKPPSMSFFDGFVVCFSPDEAFLAICYSDEWFGAIEFQVFSTLSGNCCCHRLLKPGYIKLIHAFFSPDNESIVLLVERITSLRTERASDERNPPSEWAPLSDFPSARAESAHNEAEKTERGLYDSPDKAEEKEKDESVNSVDGQRGQAWKPESPYQSAPSNQAETADSMSETTQRIDITQNQNRAEREIDYANGSREQMWEQYSVGSGDFVSEDSVGDLAITVPAAYFTWVYFRNCGRAGLGIPGARVNTRPGAHIYSVQHSGRKEVCQTPPWTQQAQIGDDRLVLTSAKYGVIVMKAPQSAEDEGVATSCRVNES